MTTITADLGKMFDHREPWDCSNSVANLGPNAGKLTWESAVEVAQNHAAWLVSPLADACTGMQEWARSCGAWDSADIESWTEVECLALFVQNIAAELRNLLSADDVELAQSVEIYMGTDWDNASEYPIGYYYEKDGRFFVDYYTGI